MRRCTRIFGPGRGFHEGIEIEQEGLQEGRRERDVIGELIERRGTDLDRPGRNGRHDLVLLVARVLALELDCDRPLRLGFYATHELADVLADGAVAGVAAFGDPGLLGARELLDIPVVGLAEAAMLTACMLGRRFAIVTFTDALAPWYEECVAMHGLGDRCAGVCALSVPIASVATVGDDQEGALTELLTQAIPATKADVLILGGAPLAGLADRIKARIPLPLVDPVQAATKQAEALVALGARKAETGTFRRPPAKEASGLAAALAKRLSHRDG